MSSLFSAMAAKHGSSPKNSNNNLTVLATNAIAGRMAGIRLIDHITNEELYKRVGLTPIIEMIRKRQLTCLGHALRRENDQIAKIFALFIPENDLRIDKRGAPKLSYREYILKTLRPCVDVERPEEVERLASDRVRWRKIVAACCKADD